MNKKDTKPRFRKVTADAVRLANGVAGMVGGAAKEVIAKGQSLRSSSAGSVNEDQLEDITAALKALEKRVKALESSSSPKAKKAQPASKTKSATGAKKSPAKKPQAEQQPSQ